MSQAKIVREEVEAEETSFSAVYIEMRNACIIFLSEGEDSLGTLAVSIPQRERFLGPPLSSILFGDRNTTVTRLLAERVAHQTKKMTLVSVHIKTVDEKTVGPVLLRLLEKVMRKEEERK